MASVCLTQTGYQQQQHHFQMLNGNIMLLQKAQQQQQTLQQSNVYQAKKQQNIAPAPKILGNSNLYNIQMGPGGDDLLPRKKYTYMNMPYGEQLPSVARRNARERNRVKQVNNGFANLRQHLPQTVINTLSHGGRGASKKLSKVDTLRIAVEYIRGLQDMLEDSQPSVANKMHVGTALCDESSNDGSNYGYSSIGSPSEVAFNQLQRSYHSEASVSPAPSYSGDSDISIGGANYLHPVKLEAQQQQPHTAMHASHLKFEAFDDFAHLSPDDEQPDDEELLDYISSWQEQ